MKSRVCLSW